MLTWYLTYTPTYMHGEEIWCNSLYIFKSAAAGSSPGLTEANSVY